MSKNIYRVNKKSDLDEIMKNNFYKPICIIFLSKQLDKKMYDDIATSLLVVSKYQTYVMIVIIDFDDFIDNIDYFSQIKSTLPHFIAFFKGKNIASCDEKDNFIPLVISKIEQIHTSYVNKIMQVFNQNENNTDGNAKENQEEVKNEDEEEVEDEENEEEDEVENEDDDDEEVENENEEEDEIMTEKSIEDNKSELIKKEKERLKKIKELKKLQNLLKK
jgi:hypothetical protein